MVPRLGISRPVTAAVAGASISDGPPEHYWSADADMLAQRLDTTRDGVSAAEAARRLRECGPNQVREHRRLTRTRVLMNQIRNPLLLVLVFAAVASALTGESGGRRHRRGNRTRNRGYWLHHRSGHA